MSDWKIGKRSFNIEHFALASGQKISKFRQWLEKQSEKSVQKGTLTEVKNRIQQEIGGVSPHGNLMRNVISISNGENLLSKDLEKIKKNLGSILKGVGQLVGFVLLKGTTKVGQAVETLARVAAKKIQKHIFKDIPTPTKLHERYGDANIHFLGGTTLPQHEISENGSLMQNGGHYFLENNVITTPQGDQIHVATAELNNLAKEWMGLGGGASGKTFNEFINERIESNPELKAIIESSTIRYFNNVDRDQTATTFEGGRPIQIGLDASNSEVNTLNPGTYAFVLGKAKFFMTPKISTEKGRIQHSSFLKGGKALSAGMIVVGENGKIISIRNQSGHYQPQKKEMAAILKYLKSNMPDEDFKNIQLSLNMNMGWRIGVANFIDHKLDIKWGIIQKPAHEWLASHPGLLIKTS